MTQKKIKGISRIDSGSTHGWLVRAYRNRKTYSKLFSDRKCGGKVKSKQQAIKHRDELRDKISSIPKDRTIRMVFRHKKNTTGELGVTRTSKASPTGKKYECYSVSWRPEPGMQKSTSFSINKYGEKQAFKLAVEHRRKMMREIHGDNYCRKLSILRKQKTENPCQ